MKKNITEDELKICLKTSVYLPALPTSEGAAWTVLLSVGSGKHLNIK